MSLYIIGTPIGNLKDITLRALEVLKSTPIIIVEHWEDSIKLLRHYEIQPQKIIKYNDATRNKLPEIIELLQTTDGAYITSAGMPSVSDPGVELVAASRSANINVVPIPGPSALPTAIAMSGMRGPFLFVEFLPRKPGALIKLFTHAGTSKEKIVCFESPYRIKKTMELLQKNYPGATVFIGKEMTKKFESYTIGTPTELLDRILKDKHFTKGEFTMILKFQ